MIEIAPSVLSADFTCLGTQIEAVQRGGAGLIHVDVMDGHFVPNITIGPMIVRALARVTDLPLDCHLMIEEPDRYIPEFARAGARMISVHAEVANHLHRTLGLIRDNGCQPGVAINPATPLTAIEEALPFVDFVLVMSVNPGFGGQQFIPTALDKISRLRDMIYSRSLDIRIEVDGGIDIDNVGEIVRRGAEWIVAGTSVFGNDDPENATRALREKATLAVAV
jgi:ribulose-phosphate 3-epimerase